MTTACLADPVLSVFEGVFNVVVNLELTLRAFIAFLAGALIGIEREKVRRLRLEEEDIATASFPGIRSFGFISMMGAFTTLTVYELPKVSMLSALLAVLSEVIIVMYVAYRLFVVKDAGITTPTAMVIAFIVGALIGTGLVIEGIAISIFTTFVLAVKRGLERFVARMSYEELTSALEIGILIFLFGPIVAAYDIVDPVFGVIRLRTLYAFFVVILSLSYAGYIIVKVSGSTAMDYFAFFGGLVHSEATLISLVRFLKDKSRALIYRVATYCTVAMMFRNLLLISAFTYMAGARIIEALSFPLMATIISAIIGYVMTLFIGRFEHEPRMLEFKLESPINYRVAIKAVAYLTAMIAFSTVATRVFGATGTLVSAFIGGFVSAESVIFSVFSLVESGDISINDAIASSMLATASAILNKALYARSAGVDVGTVARLAMLLSALTVPYLIFAMMLILPTYT